MAIHEPIGPAVQDHMSPYEHLRRGLGLIRTDHVYRRYVGAQVALSLADVSVPFFTLYAKNVLQAPDGMVGVYVLVRAAALLTANIPWGRLSDRHGNRLILRAMTAGLGLVMLMALVLLALVQGLRLSGPWLPYLALPVFLVSGALVPPRILVGSNFLVELVPEEERPLYLGLSNTLIGLALLLSGALGMLANPFGFAGLFLFSLGLYGLAFLMASRLPEPRGTATQ
jgi:MFS family permease